MLQQTLTILLFSLVLCGCVTQPVEKEPINNDLELVNERIIHLEKTLSSQFALNCAQSIQALDTQIEALKNTKETTKIVERCTTSSKPSSLDNKLLLGAIERVRLVKEDRTFNARIDTGADTSSIGVFNPQNFERDGEKWIEFSLTDKDNATVYQYPIFDTVKIKQSTSVTEERIEIKMDIEMGKKIYKKQIFNLADRGHLDYQLLIGRSFLRDITIVDVGKKNLLGNN